MFTSILKRADTGKLLSQAVELLYTPSSNVLGHHLAMAATAVGEAALLPMTHGQRPLLLYDLSPQWA